MTRRILPIFLFLVSFASCSQKLELPLVEQAAIRTVDPTALLDFDIAQYSCALFVAVRSSAWNRPIAFGGEMDESMVHWNMCPGGTMVACVVAPNANGDTVVTGIPWPY